MLPQAVRQKAVSLDSEQLQTLIDQYYPQIRRAALALCGDPWEADEIAQETFMAALKSMAALRDESATGAWLYGICLRIHRSRLRSAVRHMKRIALWAVANAKHESQFTAPMRIEVQEWQQGIWLQVRDLPQPQREVIPLLLSRASAPNTATSVGLITPVRVREVPVWQLEPRFQDEIQEAWTEAGFRPSIEL
jgi:RNA polymerase sigma factor (sigma-70 family)